MQIGGDGQVLLSPSDLSTWAACEWAFLRRLDAKLGRGEPLPEVHDDMLERTARLGDQHELDYLEILKGSHQVVEFDRPAPRFAGAPTRGALAMEPRRMAELFEAGSPLAKITTLRPKDYSVARTLGVRFRDGTPVIMVLVSMDNADAKRLVDFAAGLAFALRGSFDKVATKVFLLSPADIDVSADERRRIAEAGFYSYQ